MPKTKITAKADFSKLKAALDDLRKKTGHAIVEEAKLNAPERDGQYKSSIEACIEYGTQPHDIIPDIVPVNYLFFYYKIPDFREFKIKMGDCKLNEFVFQRKRL